jgi:hypothetical protein
LILAVLLGYEAAIAGSFAPFNPCLIPDVNNLDTTRTEVPSIDYAI